MSSYRKVHITLEEENFQCIRRLAFDNEVSISTAIDFVIEEALREDKETPPPAEPPEVLPLPEQSRPKEWSAVSRSLK
jgi:hypothetical protein